jgi:hypothetical protein
MMDDVDWEKTLDSSTTSLSLVILATELSGSKSVEFGGRK